MMPHLQAMHPVPEQSYRVRTVPYPHEELRSGMLQRVYLKFSPMPEMGYPVEESVKKSLDYLLDAPFVKASYSK